MAFPDAYGTIMGSDLTPKLQSTRQSSWLHSRHPDTWLHSFMGQKHWQVLTCVETTTIPHVLRPTLGTRQMARKEVKHRGPADLQRNRHSWLWLNFARLAMCCAWVITDYHRPSSAVNWRKTHVLEVDSESGIRTRWRPTWSCATMHLPRSKS